MLVLDYVCTYLQLEDHWHSGLCVQVWDGLAQCGGRLLLLFSFTVCAGPRAQIIGWLPLSRFLINLTVGNVDIYMYVLLHLKKGY